MLWICAAVMAIATRVRSFMGGRRWLAVSHFTHHSVCPEVFPKLAELAIAVWISEERPDQAIVSGIAGVIPYPLDRLPVAFRGH